MSTPWLPLLRGWRVRLEVKLPDLWIGAFWKLDRSHFWTHFDLWVCVVPCLPIHVAGEWLPGRRRRAFHSALAEDWQRGREL